MINRILVLSIFVVASCGLAYELIAGALSSYLLGDSVLQFSTIIGCYLFAMGVGAHVSKYVKDEDVLARFVDIEIMVGLIGGLSAALLFLSFS
ncbi:polyamine aminopropyltransferase, partial [Acinetobacter baumannii]